MSYPQHATLVHAFTDDGRGGNPAAVVLDADDLDSAARQAVARELGVSETAFVSRSATETVRLEFFTPTRQIAHCGHATIATFALLHQLGRVGEGRLSKDTIDGRREVIVQDGLVWMEQTAPRYEDAVPGGALSRQLAQSLRLDTLGRASLVHTGNRFAVIEVADVATLAALRPDLPAIAAISQAHDLIGYYVFARTDPSRGRHATTRMFAPRYGIDEEAATGMAAGPLACLLYRDGDAPAHIAIEQGHFMATPSPSLLQVRLDLDGGGISGLFAGGSAQPLRTVALGAA